MTLRDILRLLDKLESENAEFLPSQVQKSGPVLTCDEFDYLIKLVTVDAGRYVKEPSQAA